MLIGQYSVPVMLKHEIVTAMTYDIYVKYLFSCCFHVPHCYSSVGRAGHQLMGQRQIPQRLDLLTETQRQNDRQLIIPTYTTVQNLIL